MPKGTEGEGEGTPEQEVVVSKPPHEFEWYIGQIVVDIRITKKPHPRGVIKARRKGVPNDEYQIRWFDSGEFEWLMIHDETIIEDG